MLRFSLLILLTIGLLPKAATAQFSNGVVWIQIEARPTLEAAEERARIFADQLPNVNGFALQGGWYAIALGPYTPQDAETVLQSYKDRGLVPGDSYIAFSRTYGQQFWPPGDDIFGTGNLSATQPLPQDEPPAIAAAPADSRADDKETPAEARRSESLLTSDERRDLQSALRWAGVYDAAIDGAFGRGTRDAMAQWQSANGFPATGVLTTAQRAQLMESYNAPIDSLGLQLVRDIEAGIEVRMPTAAVGFARYEAPFAHYDATSDLSARVLLISQEGSRDTLRSLYEVMQTLALVPLEGPRRIDGDSFTLVGRNAQIVSETQVSLVGNEIKGFTLVWPAGDEARRSRVLQEMRDSFVRRTGVLDPAAGLGAEQQIDLVAGLEVRKPLRSRSGFFVDGSGSVVTTADAVQSCARITLDEVHDATLTGMDMDRGIAVLKPKANLAPPAIATFSPLPPRLASEVAVAGFSFEGQLDAASMTFGTLSDLRGLGGEPELSRLALDALPGDAGGPVFDRSGNVLGMLLPQPEGDRRLPDEVRFALTSEAILQVLERAGLSTRRGDAGGDLDPVDITDRGVGMTVLVSCWE